MTVSTTLDRQYFNSDGVNKVFPFNFRFFTDDQIYVSLIAPDGTITPQFLTTNYTISGALQASGGSVTMLVAPPLTVPATRVFVQRILSQVQPTSIRNQGKFYPEIHEDVFDRLTMLIQQSIAIANTGLRKNISLDGWDFEGLRGVNVGEPSLATDAATKKYVDTSSSANNSYADSQIMRTLRVPFGESIMQLPAAISRANKIMGFDANGNPIGVLPGTGTATELAFDLANSLEPDKGTSMIGLHPYGAGSYGRILSGLLNERVSLLSFIPNVEHAAIIAGTSTFNCTSAVINAAASGRRIFAPAGKYLVESAAATSIRIQGDGEGLTVFQLATSSLNPIFDASIVEVKDATLSDGGRPTIDHTAVNAAFLVKCASGLHIENVTVVTDYAVSLQSVTSGSAFATVLDVRFSRVNTPLTNEVAELNMFIGSGVSNVRFERLKTKNLVGRSIVNYTYIQSAAGVNAPVLATVRDCEFNLFRKTGTAGELKVIFLGGYQSDVSGNTFLDCFGRHIDVLANYYNAATLGAIYPNAIQRNKMSYTAANSAIQGAGKDEPGSIYCRYADVIVSDNYMDFSNLALVSNIYSAIVIRHGYRKASAVRNTIINPKAYGISADISDAIDTDNCNVTIKDNVITGHVNSSRRPIYILCASTVKKFRSVVIKDNCVESTRLYIIGVANESDRTASFIADWMDISNNWSVGEKAFDTTTFTGFPEVLTGKNITVVVAVDPAGTNKLGTVKSLTDAISTVGKYEVASLEVKLAASVTTTQTFTGPVSLAVKSSKVLVSGNNGALGRIRLYTPGNNQTGVSLEITGQEVTFSGTINNSDSAASTTALFRAVGYGHLSIKDCTSQYGEFLLESLGPDFSIKGGTINNINLGSSAANAIVFTQSDRLVRGSISGVTGANNSRLYNLSTPSLLSYDSISVGTVLGIKTSTLIA